MIFAKVFGPDIQRLLVVIFRPLEFTLNFVQEALTVEDDTGRDGIFAIIEGHLEISIFQVKIRCLILTSVSIGSGSHSFTHGVVKTVVAFSSLATFQRFFEYWDSFLIFF
jgi:hypothetical protein